MLPLIVDVSVIRARDALIVHNIVTPCAACRGRVIGVCVTVDTTLTLSCIWTALLMDSRLKDNLYLHVGVETCRKSLKTTKHYKSDRCKL